MVSAINVKLFSENNQGCFGGFSDLGVLATIVVNARLVAHSADRRQFFHSRSASHVGWLTILGPAPISRMHIRPITHTSPSGAKVEPETSYSRRLADPYQNVSIWVLDLFFFFGTLVTPPTTKNLRTDMLLVVRVPVLSLQMTEVQPRVSTDGSFRTRAFFLAIRRVPVR